MPQPRTAQSIEIGPYEGRVGLRLTFAEGTAEVFLFDAATAATLFHQGLAVVEALRQAEAQPDPASHVPGGPERLCPGPSGETRRITNAQDPQGSHLVGNVKVRGFFRVNLVEHEEDGQPRIVGDSGWVDNQITIDGLRLFVGHAMAGQAGSFQVARAALASVTTVIASNSTALPGEFGDATGASSTANRATMTTNPTTNVSGSTINYSFLWTWYSTGGFASGASKPLQGIGLFANSNAGGTCFAGAVFTSSQLTNNQDVQATYVIQVRL